MAIYHPCPEDSTERIRRERKRTKGRKMKCTVRMPRDPKNTLYSPKEIFLLHCHGQKSFKSRKLSLLPVKTKLLITNLGTEEKKCAITPFTEHLSSPLTCPYLLCVHHGLPCACQIVPTEATGGIEAGVVMHVMLFPLFAPH